MNVHCCVVFDSSNAVHREAFTHTPPQKMDKKSRQKAESSFTECIEIFGIWTKSIRLFVFALHKQNKQTKSRQQAESSFSVCNFCLH